MGIQKEHRAPVRYSLKPDENREVLAHCQSHGHITDRQMKNFANRFGCSQKTIHDAISRRGFDVLSVKPPVGQGRSRALEEARKRAEAHFTPPAEKYPPKEAAKKKDPSEEGWDLLAEEEKTLQTNFAKRESEMLEAVADLERQLAEQTQKAEEEQERAREAIQQTVNLRMETRADREALEETKGNITSLQFKIHRLEKTIGKLKAGNAEIKGELKESGKRERQLMDALRKSEADLENLRKKCNA